MVTQVYKVSKPNSNPMRPTGMCFVKPGSRYPPSSNTNTTNNNSKRLTGLQPKAKLMIPAKRPYTYKNNSLTMSLSMAMPKPLPISPLNIHKLVSAELHGKQQQQRVMRSVSMESCGSAVTDSGASEDSSELCDWDSLIQLGEEACPSTPTTGFTFSKPAVPRLSADPIASPGAPLSPAVSVSSIGSSNATTGYISTGGSSIGYGPVLVGQLLGLLNYQCYSCYMIYPTTDQMEKHIETYHRRRVYGQKFTLDDDNFPSLIKPVWEASLSHCITSGNYVQVDPLLSAFDPLSKAPLPVQEQWLSWDGNYILQEHFKNKILRQTPTSPLPPNMRPTPEKAAPITTDDICCTDITDIAVPFFEDIFDYASSCYSDSVEDLMESGPSSPAFSSSLDHQSSSSSVVPCFGGNDQPSSASSSLIEIQMPPKLPRIHITKKKCHFSDWDKQRRMGALFKKGSNITRKEVKERMKKMNQALSPEFRKFAQDFLRPAGGEKSSTKIKNQKQATFLDGSEEQRVLPKAKKERKSANGELKSNKERKCRGVYGINSQAQWCNMCKWKKRCSRFGQKDVDEEELEESVFTKE